MTKKNVLIVEDNNDVREFMELLVEGFGYETYTAASGEEAIEVARRIVPDLILMDITMPVMDGLKATEIIRSSPGFSEIPIIALTAHAKFLTEEAKKAGCVEVVGKPVDPVLLELMLARRLGASSG